jgi:hypothetical protein
VGNDELNKLHSEARPTGAPPPIICSLAMFRAIVITSFGMVIADFGIVIRVDVGS